MNKLEFDSSDIDGLPFYLLLLADPESIPFTEQFRLSVFHAVGRLWGNPEDVKSYADNVLRCESSVRPGGKFAVFAPNMDAATELSCSGLAIPVAEEFSGDARLRNAGWSTVRCLGEHATKEKYAQLATGPEAARILFSATHGALYEDHSQRLCRQGALVCSGWFEKEPLAEEYTFAASDVPDQADFKGAILVLFACCGVGTACIDGFGFSSRLASPKCRDSKDVLSSYPLRALSKGALAVVGHADIAWSSAFLGLNRPTLYSRSIIDLALGHRLGSAFHAFSDRQTELAYRLVEMAQLIALAGQDGDRPRNPQLVNTWLTRNDIRSFMIVGDPAVRLTSLSSAF